MLTPLPFSLIPKCLLQLLALSAKDSSRWTENLSYEASVPLKETDYNLTKKLRNKIISEDDKLCEENKTR